MRYDIESLHDGSIHFLLVGMKLWICSAQMVVYSLTSNWIVSSLHRQSKNCLEMISRMWSQSLHSWHILKKRLNIKKISSRGTNFVFTNSPIYTYTLDDIHPDGYRNDEVEFLQRIVAIIFKVVLGLGTHSVFTWHEFSWLQPFS